MHADSKTPMRKQWVNTYDLGIDWIGCLDGFFDILVLEGVNRGSELDRATFISLFCKQMVKLQVGEH
jgi:hypothetical protein